MTNLTPFLFPSFLPEYYFVCLFSAALFRLELELCKMCCSTLAIFEVDSLGIKFHLLPYLQEGMGCVKIQFIYICLWSKQ